MISELHAAILQAAITLGIAGLVALLYRRYHKPYFLWWSIAWTLYLGRLLAIGIYVVTRESLWLFVHQVMTGWTALALLWSALVFSRGARLHPRYLLVALFPPVWSAFAIYHFGVADQFLYAAVPAVVFLSGATLWTAWVFFRFRRQTGSNGALLLGSAFLLWGIHHLDYPLLRARGAWNPWGYYLDIIFALAVGTGILLLVLEDIDRGLGAMAALSGDLQRGSAPDATAALLGRALVLPGVRGSALYDRATGRFLRGVGACAGWEGETPPASALPLMREAVEGRRAISATGWDAPDGLGTRPPFPFAAVLPVERAKRVAGALVIVGDARDPFTALNDSFLIALGQQVGAALEHADLTDRLRARSDDLERLSARMLDQHEDERRRLSRELHDETAQVFAAVKLQLGLLSEEVPAPQARQLQQVVALVDDGITSIRSVTDQLRPSLLDDLGLLPAVRALVGDSESRTGIAATLTAPAVLPPVSSDGELAIFRAVQEGLANVARHSDARRADVTIFASPERLLVTVDDDGRGPGSAVPRAGLAGMRERLAALGGQVELTTRPGGGGRLAITLPLVREENEE
ncbi:MAG: histidine kinase [Gemmatimonadota bacterium]|nr:histidine kinase [Gemmatimonadota bacterium]